MIQKILMPQMDGCGISCQVMNITLLTSQELIKRASSYMLYLQQARSGGTSLNHTILMDETAVYLEDPRRITINEAGKRHELLHSTGFTSMRITVLLSVSACVPMNET